MVMTEQAMSPKEKRTMEAHRLRYMKDCSNQEIADRLGISVPTVERYFSESDNDKFKRFYSDMELWEFEKKMEQDVHDGVQLANNLLARAIQHDDADDKTYLRASDQALKVRKRKVELLQELGILEKPKERKEVTERSKEADDVLERLQSAYQEKQDNSKDKKESLEA